MYFNSFEFLLIFFPIVFLLYTVVKPSLRLRLLIISSMIFYAKWNIYDLGLLLFSICINYFFALTLKKYHKNKREILFLALTFNLLLLGYYKYGSYMYSENVVLPLAISFFTFQQIAYIVGVYKKTIKVERFERYLFFVLFFPQLVAGPIVEYNYLMNQIDKKVFVITNKEKFKEGLYLLSIGLFKKVVLTDVLLGGVTTQGFLTLLKYSFTIYFDFSGYSDMALGLALIFGIRLPINFNSPYKARNLVEFWRKWHITLSEFLRDHIYIPLGGSKHSKKREVFALLVTMILGGIWHGAGWNFVLWGTLHGFGLTVVHLFKNRFSLPKIVSVVFTFLYVTLLWGFFMHKNINESLTLYKYLNEFSIDIKTITVLTISALIVFNFENSNKIVKKEWFGYVAGVLFFVSLMVMVESPAKSFVYFKF